jgi:capsular exopolysaccharide synthesis family protein
MDEEDAPIPQARTNLAARLSHQLHQYKKLLWRFWWIPLLTLGISLGIQSFLLKRVAPSYESTGRMIVSVKLSIPNANVYNEELNNFFGTQVALMQSDSVRNRVNDHLRSAHPELPPGPVSIDVSLSAKTSIFNLRAVGEDAKFTQAYLQATMDEYIKLKRDLLTNAATATQASMQEELKQMAADLQNSKQDLLNYQSSNSVVFLQPSGGNSAAERLSILTQRLAEKRSDLQLSKALTLDQNLERLRGIMTQPSGSGIQSNSLPQSNPANAPANSDASQNNTPANLGEFEEAYLQTKRQVISLKGRRDEISELATNAFELVGLDKEIAHQERLLELYKEQSQEQLQNRQHALELEIQYLEGQVKEWEAKALDVSKKLADYEALKENQQRKQLMYDQMQANLQTLDVNKGIGQESVTILESAGPASPVPPEKQKHLVMAGLIGLVLGIGILVLINQLDDRPSSFTELEQIFDVPVLGQIPLVKAKDKKTGVPILQLDDDRYPLIEANRNLRSAFLYKDSLKGQPKEQPKSIVITSACPNDGKSMTAANFAITLAQAGARVLLIDADLRRGVLHKYFPVASSPGLAEVLAGQCAWSTALVQTHIPNLHLLPCGITPRHSHNLFAASGKFLAEIAGHYDYYIFDTAPVMVADDVLSLAPNVDGLIMVIRAGFTSARVAHAALDLLHLRRVNVMGLVFNSVHPKTGDYYYYRYKKYYPQPPTK